MRLKTVLYQGISLTNVALALDPTLCLPVNHFKLYLLLHVPVFPRLPLLLVGILHSLNFNQLI